jgi:hypothetical protein
MGADLLRTSALLVARFVSRGTISWIAASPVPALTRRATARLAIAQSGFMAGRWDPTLQRAWDRASPLSAHFRAQNDHWLKKNPQPPTKHRSPAIGPLHLVRAGCCAGSPAARIRAASESPLQGLADLAIDKGQELARPPPRRRVNLEQENREVPVSWHFSVAPFLQNPANILEAPRTD